MDRLFDGRIDLLQLHRQTQASTAATPKDRRNGRTLERHLDEAQSPPWPWPGAGRPGHAAQVQLELVLDGPPVGNGEQTPAHPPAHDRDRRGSQAVGTLIGNAIELLIDIALAAGDHGGDHRRRRQ